MTNQEKLKLVEDKIKELVPEIMELKFGCWINYGMFPLRELRRGIVFEASNWNKGGVGVLHNGVIPDFIIIERDINKIIGRDITLEDIIFSLSKVADKYTGKKFPTQSHYLGHLVLNILSIYSFHKPLHEQPEDLINFLYQVFYDQRNK